MDNFEEYTILPRTWGWILLFLICGVLIGFGLLSHSIVKTVPRHWDFGQLPDYPSQHPFSTFIHENKTRVPEQLPPLPSVYTVKHFSNNDSNFSEVR